MPCTQIIDSKTFTKTEDHEVLIEKKRYELEHRPVEKQVSFVVLFLGHALVLEHMRCINAASVCAFIAVVV